VGDRLSAVDRRPEARRTGARLLKSFPALHCTPELGLPLRSAAFESAPRIAVCYDPREGELTRTGDSAPCGAVEYMVSG